jgi:hypothetical protein
MRLRLVITLLETQPRFSSWLKPIDHPRPCGSSPWPWNARGHPVARRMGRLTTERPVPWSRRPCLYNCCWADETATSTTDPCDAAGNSTRKTGGFRHPVRRQLRQRGRMNLTFLIPSIMRPQIPCSSPHGLKDAVVPIQDLLERKASSPPLGHGSNNKSPGIRVGEEFRERQPQIQAQLECRPSGITFVFCSPERNCCITPLLRGLVSCRKPLGQYTRVKTGDRSHCLIGVVEVDSNCQIDFRRAEFLPYRTGIVFQHVAAWTVLLTCF